jgi:hypothetical protein
MGVAAPAPLLEDYDYLGASLKQGRPALKAQGARYIAALGPARR